MKIERDALELLGGVRFDHARGLAGHSDGDVIAHALIDALLGAANLGDIGLLFPSEDDRHRGRGQNGDGRNMVEPSGEEPLGDKDQCHRQRPSLAHSRRAC